MDGIHGDEDETVARLSTTSSVAGHKSIAVTSKYGTLANGLKQLPTSKTFIFSGTFFIYRHCEQSNPIQDSNKRCSRDLFSKPKAQKRQVHRGGGVIPPGLYPTNVKVLTTFTIRATFVIKFGAHRKGVFDKKLSQHGCSQGSNRLDYCIHICVLNCCDVSIQSSLCANIDFLFMNDE
uniref:Uncharacterized protein n=1 Tax=Glossina pallidipes TaxID=7398 RepID=A0A1B0AFJ8_GLOPL